jgi:uncharacterized protein (TIGR00299 family) protein
MKVAHFDPITGASGDMILGALVDAGAPIERIRDEIEKLGLPHVRIEAVEVRHRGMRAIRMTIEVPDEKNHRHLPEIESILERAPLSNVVRERARRVFARLAEAESRAHGIPLERVHFHEVGALDAIVDVVGASVALELLAIEAVTFSPLRVGTGEVDTAHGRMPVPVPAVLELTKGVPIVRTDIPFEILTPTGAAILTTWGEVAMPGAFVTDAVGVSCGSRELPDRPNLLRVSIGNRAATRAHSWETDEVVVLETNLDDMNPEVLPAVLEDALAAGALDAFLTPVLMKKGRPGHVLTVLCTEDASAAIADLLFRETTTFGIRRATHARWKLARETRELATPWGPVRVKVGDLGGGGTRVVPEFESCRAIADRTGRPLLEVYGDVERHIRSTEWVSE